MLKKKIINIKKIISENKLECICFIILAYVFFIHCWKILCGSDDDLFGFLMVQSDNWAIMKATAKLQGRFQFNFTTYVSWFPFIFNSFIIYKVISYLTILFDLYMLFILTKKCFNQNVAMLSVIILLGFAQLDGYYNLFLGFVMGHQACIGFLLWGIWLFLKYYDTKKSRYLLFSEIAMFWAQMFFETFLLFNLILLIIVLLKGKKNKNILKQGLLDLRFHISGSIIYVALYLVYRLLNPSNYSGNKIEIVNFGSVLETMQRFIIGEFPLRQILLRGNLKELVNYYEPIYLTKAIFFAGIVCYVIKKADKLDVKRTLSTIGFFVFGMFLSPLLHAFTYKYAVECAHWKSYLPSFFCYFFLCAIIPGIVILMYQHINFKKVLLICVFCISVAICLVTDLGNASYAQTCEKEKNRRLAYYNIIQSEDFLTIDNNATIYQPDWTGVYGSLVYVKEWLQKKYNKNFNLTFDKEDITTFEYTYYLKYIENINAVYYGDLNTEFCTNNIKIRNIGEDEDFSVIIISNEDVNTYIINGNKVIYGKTAVIPFENVKKDNYMYIECENISIDNIYFLKGKGLNNKVE